MADGGSTDDTVKIAKSHRTKVLKNPKRIAEYGKKIAFDKATGELVVLLDTDNVIASGLWLRKMLKPFERKDVIGVESEYLIRPDFSSLNKYVACLVIADPLARFMASRPMETHDFDGYSVKTFEKNASVVTGANGFIWRKEAISDYINSSDELNEVTILMNTATVASIKIARVPGIGIYHYYAEGLRDYVRKRQKIANKHLLRSTRGKTWVQKRGSKRLIFAVLYLGTLVGPTIEALINISKGQSKAWMWHPLVSMLTVMVYMVSLIAYKFDSWAE